MSAGGAGGRRAVLGSLLAAGSMASTSQAALADTPRSSPWSFSTFLDAIDQNLVEKVSFSPDGKQVLVIDRDGNRHEALILNGESTELVKKLTQKGITFAVQAPQEAGAAQGLLGVLPSLLLPIGIIGGLFFLQRRNQEGGGGGMGGMGGGGGPMGMGK